VFWPRPHPCGRAILKSEGNLTEVRFVAAPLEHVKASVLRALPAVGARLTKNEGSHIEAKIDQDLLKAQRNATTGSEGVKGQIAFGTLLIDLTPAAQDSIMGTRLAIQFAKSLRGKVARGLSFGLDGGGKYATPLAEETMCLATLLSPAEPTNTPRSGASANPVLLKAGTLVKVALRDYFYTKEISKKADTAALVLEVVEDVHSDDGSVVIRKGSLAKGTVSGLTTAKSFGRNAVYRLSVESATAVDGQQVALDSATVERKGSSDAAVAGRVAFTVVGFLLFHPPSGAMEKGQEGLVRAGTSWEIPTAKEITVQPQ
jgi:hypothetical protein